MDENVIPDFSFNPPLYIAVAITIAMFSYVYKLDFNSKNNQTELSLGILSKVFIVFKVTGAFLVFVCILGSLLRFHNDSLKWLAICAKCGFGVLVALFGVLCEWDKWAHRKKPSEKDFE